MFLWPESLEHNNHTIHPDWRLTSDHAPLTVNISIFEEYIQIRKCMLVKNSEEKNSFINKLMEAIKETNTDNIHNKDILKQIIQEIASTIERIWYRHSKIINITKHSKEWWNEHCHRDLKNYQWSRCINDWKRFRSTIKKTKHNFFDLKIQEVANKSSRPWELMNWVKKCKLPAIKAIWFNSRPYIKIDNLWQALHQSFNSVQNYQTNPHLLNEISHKEISKWNSISKKEFTSAIEKYNNSSTPEPDKLS